MTVSAPHDITDRTILFLEKFTDDELSELTVDDIEQGVYAFASRCDEDQIYEMIEILESSFYVLSESKTLTQLEESVVLCIVESLKSFIKSAGKKVAKTAGYLTGLPIRIAKGLAYHYGRGYARGRGPNYGARGAQPQDSYDDDDDDDYDYDPPDYSPPRAPRRTRQAQPVGYALPATGRGNIMPRAPRRTRQAQPVGYVLPRTPPGYAYQGPPRQAPGGRARRSRVGPFGMGVRDEYARQAQRAAAAAAAAAPRTVPASTRTPAQRAAAAAAAPRTVPASTRTPAQRAAAAAPTPGTAAGAQTPAAATPRPSANPRAAGGATPTSTRNRNRPAPAAAAPTPGTAAGAQTPATHAVASQRPATSPSPSSGTAATPPGSTGAAAPSTQRTRTRTSSTGPSGATATPPSSTRATAPSTGAPAAASPRPSGGASTTIPRSTRSSAPSTGVPAAASTSRSRTRSTSAGATGANAEPDSQSWRFVQSPRDRYSAGRTSSTSTSPLNTGLRTIRSRISQSSPTATEPTRTSLRRISTSQQPSGRFSNVPRYEYPGANLRALKNAKQMRRAASATPRTVTSTTYEIGARPSETSSEQNVRRTRRAPSAPFASQQNAPASDRWRFSAPAQRPPMRTYGRIREELFDEIVDFLITEGYADNYISALRIINNLNEDDFNELALTVFSD